MMENKNVLDDKFFARAGRHMTWCNIPVEPHYSPENIRHMDYRKDIGDPGEFPYTRGIFPDMYRGRLWTMRELVGFDSPKRTNERIKLQIEEGANALNLIGDIPAQTGIDSDHPMAEADVGAEGVPLCSVLDWDICMSDIDMERVSINFSNYISPLLACMFASAEEKGVDPKKLRGTFLNDTLAYLLTLYYPKMMDPFDIGRRMTVDTVLYCMDYAPRVYTLSTGPEGLREHGASAMQEIAFDFCIARYWFKEILKKGQDNVNIDQIAPKMGFTHRVGLDIFEEASKFRAARRVWANMLRDEFGTENPRSCTYKVYAITMGSQLQGKQIQNNLVRITCQTLAAVLGGVQGIHTMGYDEPVCLPTEESLRLALRTQQIICHETGVVNVADPLGGSYYVESLTNQIEREIVRIMDEYKDSIADKIVSGEIFQVLRQGAYKYQKEVEDASRSVVGVNCFKISEEEDRQAEVHRADPESVSEHLRNLKDLKRTRDQNRTAKNIEHIIRTCEDPAANIFPALLDAARARATVGEMMGAIRMGHGAEYDPFGQIAYPF
ncbi:MAG: methylmalonyl-CoA mutase [Deltaproteobacteria bacterium]|nr:methylmalonyl-CoA mutase [Deltaproteobacteria bacterium]